MRLSQVLNWRMNVSAAALRALCSAAGIAGKAASEAGLFVSSAAVLFHKHSKSQEPVTNRKGIVNDMRLGT